MGLHHSQESGPSHRNVERRPSAFQHYIPRPHGEEGSSVSPDSSGSSPKRPGKRDASRRQPIASSQSSESARSLRTRFYVNSAVSGTPVAVNTGASAQDSGNTYKMTQPINNQFGDVATHWSNIHAPAIIHPPEFPGSVQYHPRYYTTTQMDPNIHRSILGQIGQRPIRWEDYNLNPNPMESNISIPSIQSSIGLPEIHLPTDQSVINHLSLLLHSNISLLQGVTISQGSLKAWLIYRQCQVTVCQ